MPDLSRRNFHVIHPYNTRQNPNRRIQDEQEWSQRETHLSDVLGLNPPILDQKPRDQKEIHAITEQENENERGLERKLTPQITIPPPSIAHRSS